ncbi:MAG: phospholipase D-like domain-containing protein [Anaerolineales bacterium]
MSSNRNLVKIAAGLTLIILISLFSIFQIQGENETLSPTRQESAESEWYALYFSDPMTPESRSLRGGPDEVFAAAIREASYSVDVAAYDFDLWSMRDALIDAHRRGIHVRFVTDGDHLLEPEVQDLHRAGIEIVADRGEHLMHHKFIVHRSHGRLDGFHELHHQRCLPQSQPHHTNKVTRTRRKLYPRI